MSVHHPRRLHLHTATLDLRIIAVRDVNPADLDVLMAALVQAQ